VRYKASLGSGSTRERSRSSSACPRKPWRLCGPKDTGTLRYEIYFNDDQSECVVYERYRDSAAVIEHGAHVGEVMQAIFATGSGSSVLLGEPSAELAAMLAGGGVAVFRPFLSM
jgi:hypothetical protein